MSIYAESSDNNAKVCKPEYFKKSYDRSFFFGKLTNVLKKKIQAL
jgi:hypothetical protein